MQLVVWDNQERSLVGAYRMGKTDELRKERDASAIYLSQMFQFSDDFYEGAPPSLELGRSFVVPEHQKSFHALYLLWQGIGRFLLTHPRYRRLYGTVSLSRQYSRALALLCDALITPSPNVRPRHPLKHPLHPEWRDYRRREGALDLPTLSALVRGLDGDGKDLPILLKHYYKLGAQFHCVGVDPNFNDTPGLLLSVDIPALEPKVLSTFLGNGAAAYLAFDSAPRRRTAEWSSSC
ncbi:MAG: GNAT family N-acetyltransferase [Dehalococcoidia bacterium]